MQAYVVSYTKYVIAASIVLYTLLAYLGLPTAETRRRTCEVLQRLCMAVFMINAYLTLAILNEDVDLLIFGLVQLALYYAFAFAYRTAYRTANKLMFNNILMLLSIGVTIIARINYAKAQKQVLIALAGLAFMLLFPIFRSRLDGLRKFSYLYAVVGIAALAGVLLSGKISNGSYLTFSAGDLSFQPSEFVKILFLLWLASAFCGEISRRRIFVMTLLAVIHVGILVLSKDLGSALIFFVVYLAILFMATGNWGYLVGGAVLGVLGAVICYFLFAHVRVRVEVWLDPWSYIDSNGYQITQSLFSLSFGGLFGAGLTQGMPTSIPFVESDFIFAAIVEEMGIVVGVCLLLILLNIFINFMMLASRYTNRFYQLYVFGTAIAFIFQAFLTVGGEVKFIPLTGVTLPLVSYGGSSVLATLMMFGIVGAIFMLQEERMIRFRMRYEEEQRMRDYNRRTQYGQTQQAPQRGTAHEAGREGDGEGKNDFYKDFKGVPIYDPGKDYEDMNHFDV